jgi:hypothetical protein
MFSDTEPDGGTGQDGSSASSGGTSSGSGGSGGSQSTTGGASSTGGAAGGGTGGTRSEGGAGDCAAPRDVTDAAICLTISPESMTFESDPRFDGSGVLVVQVFDRPDPPSELEDTIALYSRAWPPDLMGTEESLSNLPAPRILIADAPDTVYVRVYFADNDAIFEGTEDIVAGTWVGGLDLTNGLVEGAELSPVTIATGQGNDVDVSLIAMRELTVTVNVSAVPLGDGEGPLSIVAVDSADLGNSQGTYGFGTAGCVDVADAPLTVTGLVLGAGPYWVTGVLNDLGGGGALPAGSLVAFDYDAQTMTATIPQQLTIPSGAYRLESTIDLSLAIPVGAEAGAPGPNSCADLAPADGGI